RRDFGGQDWPSLPCVVLAGRKTGVPSGAASSRKAARDLHVRRLRNGALARDRVQLGKASRDLFEECRGRVHRAWAPSFETALAPQGVTNRWTNASARSATSRQPWSMVSE